MNKIFITGTDTGIGKTYICKLLLEGFNKHGYKTLGIKPIASGYKHPSLAFNEDALILQQASSVKASYSRVNPILMADAIAPNIAAERLGINLHSDQLTEIILNSCSNAAQINIIEGVGGWAVPLNKKQLLSDMVKQLNIPVILVAGIKLGCLNHSILSYQNMLANKINLVGWIANCCDAKCAAIAENIETLKSWIDLPCLGIVKYNQSEINSSIIKKISLIMRDCNTV